MVGTLQDKLHDTIHGNPKLPPKALADLIDVEYSTLIRYGLPTDTSGADIPLRRWKRLLKATKNHSTLKHIAAECGLLVVKIPRALTARDDQNELVARYQEVCSSASQLLVQFFRAPSEEGRRQLMDVLTEVMEQSAAIRQAIRDFDQLELFED